MEIDITYKTYIDRIIHINNYFPNSKLKTTHIDILVFEKVFFSIHPPSLHLIILE